LAISLGCTKSFTTSQRDRATPSSKGASTSLISSHFIWPHLDWPRFYWTECTVKRRSLPWLRTIGTYTSLWLVTAMANCTVHSAIQFWWNEVRGQMRSDEVRWVMWTLRKSCQLLLNCTKPHLERLALYSTALIQKHSSGGCTIDMLQSNWRRQREQIVFWHDTLFCRRCSFLVYFWYLNKFSLFVFPFSVMYLLLQFCFCNSVFVLISPLLVMCCLTT